MKKQTRIVATFLSLLALVSLTPVGDVFAAAKIGLYLTPASQTVTNGTVFAVRFMADVSNRSPGAITIRGKLNFPKNILNVTSIVSTGSNYTMNASTSYDNATGTVTFNRSNYFPTDASTFIFTVNFKAVGVGSATVSIDPTTQAQNNPALFAKSATYISNAPTCPAGQIGTPPNCAVPPPPPPKPKPTPIPAPVSATAPVSTLAPTPSVASPPSMTPDIPAADTPTSISSGDMSIKDAVAKPTWTKSLVNWGITSSDITTAIKVGTSKTSLNLYPEPHKQDDGTYTATVEKLLPGTRYYYEITAIAITSPDQKAIFTDSFVTRGYPTVLTLTKDSKPISGTKIIIGKETYTSNKKGQIELELANKTYEGRIRNSDGSTKIVAFTVVNKPIPTDGKAPAIQSFTFDVATVTPASAQPFPIWGTVASAIGIVGTIGGLVAFLIYRRKKTIETPLPATVIDNYTWTIPPQQDLPAANVPPLEASSQVDPSDDPVLDSLRAIEQQYIPEAANYSPVQTDAQVTQQPYYEELAPIATTLPSTTTLIDSPDTIDIDTPIAQPLAEDTAQREAKMAEAPSSTATELPKDPPTDAIYNSSTGELDIIHHSTHTTFAPHKVGLA